MKRITTHAATAAVLLLAAALPASGDSKDDYKVFVVRNPFGLKPPEVVKVPVETNKPPETIKLSGIIALGGVKRALFVKQEPGQAKPEYLSMVEGMQLGAIEVISIDEVAGSVQIKNGGVAETLDFKKNGVKPPVTAAVNPSAIPGGGVVQGQGFVNPNAAVTAQMPANATAYSSRAGYAAPPATGSTTAGAAAPAGGNVDTGLRPSAVREIRREIRFAPQANSVPPPAQAVDPVAQTIQIEANRIRTLEQVNRGELPPLPSTDATPLLNPQKQP